MRSPNAPLHLTLSDPERSNSRSLRFQSVISRKGAKLTINRKTYMASPMTPSLLISVTLKSVISHQGAELGPMLLLTINRKLYMASPMTPSLLTLNDSEVQSQGHWDFKALYPAK